jgi:DNA-binding transcriptional LysR family regulator
MELRHLRYFVAVAEELHFGHAANRLHTSQPSLSQQIRNLERELKVQLLVRTKRSVELAPAGHQFLAEAREILARADRAVGLARETAREESSKLVLGISAETDWRLLGRVLRLFAEHDPSVEILFENLTPEAQVEALRAGRIDLGFVALPIEAEGLDSETTARVRLMVALPEKHPMARNAQLRLESLSKEAYTLWPRHFSPASYDQLLAVFRKAGFGPPITMAGDLPSTHTVLGMIAAGLTIALVDPALRQMAAPGVVFRELAGQGVFTETGVIYRRNELSPIPASFLQELRETIRRNEFAETPARNQPKKARSRRKTARPLRSAAGRRASSGAEDP